MQPTPQSIRLCTVLLTFLVVPPLFSACDGSKTVEVNLHGVNHTVDTFNYSVKNPKLKGQGAGGGELIDPFGAGGTTCCVTLPKTWRPGIQLQVNTTHWVDRGPEKELLEVKETHLVEVPEYPDGQAGELWVLRAPDGKVSVVSSDLQPDHPGWPGEIKGWPVPSLKYRQERWKIILNSQLSHVDSALSLLHELKTDPKGSAEQAWKHAKEYEQESVKGFSGPDDPKYRLFLEKDYEEYFRRSKESLKQIMEEKP